jgi:hypothetical protein
MHPIKRGALIALFSFGALAGFGHGIASVACHAGSCHQQRRAAFEDHVAEVCTRAAERARTDHDSDRDRDRDYDRRPDPRFIPYGAPQWGWGPPPAPAYAPPPAPPSVVVTPPAPADAPAPAPVTE